ncbi:MAG: glycosyltransferase family 2 protein [Spirochaeta sp.]|jgi:teichuronic acid biosynthesis glycosyltransferase TuaG|nr:glycosyltransferase family 2 protein [Spirochaeta sp.]
MRNSDSGPLVSVIMPAHNVETTIEESVTSVIGQTLADWELLIVDDRSNDQTIEIITHLLSDDSRIRMFETSNEYGPAAARNLAISKAQGRFIAFLDSDDIWLPNKLHVQIEHMQSNELALSYSWFERVDLRGNRSGRVVKVPACLSYSSLLKKNHIGCLTAIYDSSRIGKRYMPDIPVHQDWALWLSILREGRPAGGVNEVLALYRTGNTSSVSGNKFRTAKHKWRIYRELEKLDPFRSAYYLANFAWNGFHQARI